jgi:hypothetical protein
MILQTRAKTLAALLAKDGGKCPHLQAVRDAIILAREEAGTPPAPSSVGNDRTNLPHQKTL